MAFHLEKPYLNNIGKTKTKKSVKQIKAQQEHDIWLRKQGLHMEQLQAKPQSKPQTLKKVVTVDRSGPGVSNGFAPAGAKKSVFDSAWKHTYDHDPLMAEREAEALRRAEARKSNIMQTYNKGPVMVAGDLKMTELGRRR